MNTRLLLKTLILGLVLNISKPVFADEGMWIPMLIGKNYDQMKSQGFKLTPQDLYDINKASLKDAIVSFGGFCTGELVSKNGLLFTNHHCGYDAIATESTPENNILDNGFYAKNYNEERPIKGLFVNFLVKIEDVTDKILTQTNQLTGTEKEAKITEIGDKLAAEATKGTHYNAFVRDFFKGNQYFLFVMEKFTDIRLVGTPPQSIGKFGGDTDNWVWPRQTGDFSIFRVYAGKDNKPAAYAKDNKPYSPKKYLPVSVKGVENNDFAMVYGFPGRTDRFLTSYGVSLAIDSVSPEIVKLRDIRLKAWKKEMDKDVAFRLKISSQYASVANYWKYFIGQSEQLKALKIEDKKRAEEQEFNQWVGSKPEYAGLMQKYNELYTNYAPYAKHRVFITEGFYASKWVANILKLQNSIEKLTKEVKGTDAYNNLQKTALETIESYKETYNATADKAILTGMLTAFYEDIPKNQHPAFYNNILKKYKAKTPQETFEKYANALWKESVLIDPDKLTVFINNPNQKKFNEDIAYQYAKNLVIPEYISKNLGTVLKDFENQKQELDHLYFKALLKKNEGKLMYPDANSTMRITYGNVQNYAPKDGVLYEATTTIDGVMEKYIPNDSEFDLPANFLAAYKARNFGSYCSNGTLVVNFISNNDITGGNSGSPVINGNGELIGLAFDGNWEAMSGDIAFDKKFKRSINVDIRYVLWCIDVLGGAKNIIDELEIRK